MTEDPPRHISIAGALVMAAGTGSVIGMLARWVRGEAHFDLGFVFLIIGYGILAGRSSSRKWAMFFAGAGLLVLPAAGVWMWLDGQGGGDAWQNHDAVLLWIIMALISSCCLYVLLVLTRKEHRSWFDEMKTNHPGILSQSWAAVVLATVLYVPYHATGWWIERTHRDLYVIDTKVSPRDADSGEGINVVGFSQDRMAGAAIGDGTLPKISGMHVSTRDGLFLEFSGIATRPVEITVSSDGYRDATVVLDRDTPRELELSMQPEEPGPDG